jgi:hypothetical protein
MATTFSRIARRSRSVLPSAYRNAVFRHPSGPPDSLDRRPLAYKKIHAGGNCCAWPSVAIVAVNEKLQIPTAICGTPRFQFQFPRNGLSGYRKVEAKFSENATLREFVLLKQQSHGLKTAREWETVKFSSSPFPLSYKLPPCDFMHKPVWPEFRCLC